MAMYATPTQLAGFLQKDLDSYSATQALETATERFSKRARTRWAATTSVYSFDATFSTSIALPYRPVTAITAVRVNGTPIAVDYTLRRNKLYRLAGFGNPYAWPPDAVEIEYTYGHTAVPDDVRLGVLELAGSIYEHPDSGVVSESIDDYRVTYYTGNTIAPAGRSWQDIADHYAGLLVA